MIHELFQPFIDLLFSNDLSGKKQIEKAKKMPPLEEIKNENQGKQIPE